MTEENIIVSAKNPVILRAAELKEKKARDQRRLFLAEGKRILQDVQDKSLIEELFVLSGKRELSELSSRFSCPVHFVSEQAFRKLSDTVNGEGIVAVVKKREREEVLGNKVLVLDRVNDPANVGTLLRSACAFGFGTVVSLGSADFYNPKVVRGSMGAALSLNLVEADDESVSELLKGYEIYAADMCGEELSTVSAPEKLALVVGNEARGISSKLVSIATKFVKIAMSEQMESLNAGVAGSIEMYHFK